MTICPRMAQHVILKNWKNKTTKNKLYLYLVRLWKTWQLVTIRPRMAQNVSTKKWIKKTTKTNSNFVPGTATKNLTASLCPWKESWACAMEQNGMKLPGVTLSVLLSPYTLITPPGPPLLCVTCCFVPKPNNTKQQWVIVATRGQWSLRE